VQLLSRCSSIGFNGRPRDQPVEHCGSGRETVACRQHREKSGSEKREEVDNWWLLAWPALAITPGCVRDKSCKEHNGARQSDPAGLSGSAPFNAPQPDLQIRSLPVIIRRRERPALRQQSLTECASKRQQKSHALTGDKSLSRRSNSLLRAFLLLQITLSCFLPLGRELYINCGSGKRQSPHCHHISMMAVQNIQFYPCCSCANFVQFFLILFYTIETSNKTSFYVKTSTVQSTRVALQQTTREIKIATIC
jgi:hypothetical protein